MTRTVLSGAIAIAMSATLQAAPPARQRAADSSASIAATSAAVQQALERELAGENTARASLLRQRLSESPDDRSVHWHLGEVRLDDKWVPYDRVADQGDRWRELYRYSEERAKRKNTVDDQLFLADGARAHGLWDQEQAHLMQVVALDPRHEEAHQRLGDVYADGAWIRKEVFDKTMRSQLRWSDSVTRYGKEAERFVSRMARLDANTLAKPRDEWRAWIDPEKLPALERAIGDRGDAFHAAYIHWLGQLSCYEASRGLVRQALFSENELIRLLAAEELKQRPWEDYMRELVASLTVVNDAKEVTYDGRSNAHTVSFAWETMDAIVETQWTLRHPIDVTAVSIIYERAGRDGATQDRVGIGRVRVDRHDAIGKAASKVWRTLRQTQADLDITRNERALRTIGRVTGTPVATAREAWSWWGRTEDAIRAHERISRNYEDSWYVDNRRRTIQPAMFPVYQVAFATVEPPHSCLVGGTCLVTETGPRAVETLEIGDRVLSQDLETGELAFKPVVAKTVREKAKLFRLKTKDEEIVASQGHPFWVNAVGWVQARALQVGMPLHTVSGATEVTAVEPAGEQAVYNVVVADTHTYFVGKSQAFLSHDVTPRGATNALVPGLMPIWDVPSVESEKPLTAR